MSSVENSQWQLLVRKAKANGDAQIDLKSEVDMRRWLDVFFLNPDNQLYTVPHLSQIKRKNLFRRDIKDKIFDTDTVPHLSQIKRKNLFRRDIKDKIFDTEVIDVFQYLCDVGKLTGFGFHGYDVAYAKKTFSEVNNFETDWILVNKSGIYVIEVGEAEDPSKPNSIIKEKRKQLETKSKFIINGLLNAAGKPHLLQCVNKVLAFTNITVEQIRDWMNKNQEKVEKFDKDVLYFASESKTEGKLFFGNTLEHNLSMLDMFGNTLDNPNFPLQDDLKYVAALLCHGYHSTQIPGQFPKVKLSKDDKTDQVEKMKKKNFKKILKFPEDLILSPRQLDAFGTIVSSDQRLFDVVGEAGTGKTTILQLLLVYYAGKKLEKPENRLVLFIIRHTKRGFIRDMEKFICENCHQNMVRLCSNTSLAENLLEKAAAENKAILLLNDEEFEENSADSFMTQFSDYIWKWPSIKTVITTVLSCHTGSQRRDNKSTKGRRLNLTDVFRSSLHISNVASKARISADSTNKQPSLNLGVFFHATREKTVEFETKNLAEFNAECPLVLDENWFDESVEKNWTSAVICCDFSPAALRCDEKTKVYLVHRLYPEEVYYYNFTGIEVDVLTILVKLSESYGKHYVSPFELVYQAISRARIFVKVVSSADIIEPLKAELELASFDNVKKLIQAHKPVTKGQMMSAMRDGEETESSAKFSERFLECLQLAVSVCNIKATDILKDIADEKHNTSLAQFLTSCIFEAFEVLDESSNATNLVNHMLAQYPVEDAVKLFQKRYTINETSKILISSVSDGLKPLLEAALPEMEGSDWYTTKYAKKNVAEFSALLGCVELFGQCVQHLEPDFARECIQIAASQYHGKGRSDHLAILETLHNEGKLAENAKFDQLVSLPKFNDAVLYIFQVCPNLLSESVDGKTVLHFACINGSPAEVIEQLIEMQPQLLGAKDERGFTPFEYAFVSKFEHIQQLVLPYYEKLVEMDTLFSTGYMLSYLGHWEKLQELGLDELNKETNSGENFLTAACKSGKFELVKNVRESEIFGEVVMRKPSSGYWPVYYSCLNGFHEIVELFVDIETVMEARNGPNEETLLHAAATGGFPKVVEVLLNKCPQLSAELCKEGYSALSMACKENNLEAIKLLYQKDNGALIVGDAFNGNALLVAAKYASAPAIIYLLEASKTNLHENFIIDDQEMSVLEISIKYQKLDTITQLCEKYLENIQQIPQIPEKHESFLRTLLCEHHECDIWPRYLVEERLLFHFFHHYSFLFVPTKTQQNPSSALRSRFGETGETVLHKAVRANAMTVAKALLREDATFELTNILSNDGFSPLSFACSRKMHPSVEMAKFLYRANPESVRIGNKYNANAFLVAATCIHPEALCFLLEQSGQDVNEIVEVEKFDGEWVQTSILEEFVRHLRMWHDEEYLNKIGAWAKDIPVDTYVRLVRYFEKDSYTNFKILVAQLPRIFNNDGTIISAHSIAAEYWEAENVQTLLKIQPIDEDEVQNVLRILIDEEKFSAVQWLVGNS